MFKLKSILISSLVVLTAYKPIESIPLTKVDAVDSQFSYREERDIEVSDLRNVSQENKSKDVSNVPHNKKKSETVHKFMDLDARKRPNPLIPKDNFVSSETGVHKEQITTESAYLHPSKSEFPLDLDIRNEERNLSFGDNIVAEYVRIVDDTKELEVLRELENNKNGDIIDGFNRITLPFNFSLFDADGDGFIRLGELINATGQAEHVEDAFSDTDADGDGKVSKVEYDANPWGVDMHEQQDPVLNTDVTIKPDLNQKWTSEDFISKKDNKTDS